ncbi:MAG: ASKHA domain-containing protein [Candidatus Omnitrophota bacterium]
MKLGIAIDVGTSKVEGSLVDLASGKELAFESLPNKQFMHGADVLSRLNFALTGVGGLNRLNRELIETICALADDLVDSGGHPPADIGEIVCVGNSAMHHLALSIVPRKLARAPFRPSSEGEKFTAKAGSLGIAVCPEADFEFLPNLGGFVGSDAIAVIISSGLYKSDSLNLIIDIGSNGEVVLGTKDRIVVASTSAGPAFEGWKISCGMPAVRGAIESVSVGEDNTIRFTTIGNEAPAGVCGSALIDLLRSLLDMKVLDRSGRIAENRFRIHNELYLTQQDVRELQLAKAAIQAAVKILRGRFEEKIDTIFLTGRFGNHLSKESARRIGIVPKDISLEKVSFIPHGALKGAKMILCDQGIRKIARDIHQKVTHVRLHEEKSFQDEFVGAMSF